jgi:hypothetical protein
MNRLRKIWLSSYANFRKRRLDWRTYILIISTLCFAMWNLSGLKDLARDYDLNVSAWVFPHYLANPTMTLVYCCFVILLYCDAPFMDSHMSQIVLHIGRVDWLIGQFLFIVISSLVYALWLALSVIIVLIPHVSFANEWGNVLYGIAQQTSLIIDYNIVLSVTENMLEAFTPLKAMVISIGLAWLVSIFYGTSIMCANIVINRRAGYIVGGFWAFWSYFAAYLGVLMFGYGILSVSPATWVSMYVFNWNGYAYYPDFATSVTVLIVSTLIMFGISLFAFCKRDLDIRQEGILS